MTENTLVASIIGRIVIGPAARALAQYLSTVSPDTMMGWIRNHQAITLTEDAVIPAQYRNPTTLRALRSITERDYLALIRLARNNLASWGLVDHAAVIDVTIDPEWDWYTRTLEELRTRMMRRLEAG